MPYQVFKSGLFGGKGLQFARHVIAGFILFVFLVGALSGCTTAAKTRKLNNAEAHYKIGISNLNNNMLQLAYVEFQHSVDKNPKAKKSYYALGHIFFVQKNYPEAEKVFKKAIRIDKKYSDAHNYLGMVYERMRNHELAVREFKKALENNKYLTPHKAHYNMGRNYVQLGKIEEAIEEFQKAVTVAPDYAAGFNALGKALVRKERPTEAVEAFNTALKIAPNFSESRFYLGESYLKIGSESLAEEQFKQVILLAPGSELARSAKKKLDAIR